MHILQEGTVLLIADYGNNRVALWRLRNGTLWKHLGSEGSAQVQFVNPQAVAVTALGALVVTDENRVQVLTLTGAVVCVLDPTAVAGMGRLGSEFFGAAVCPCTGDIFVTDYKEDRLVAIEWEIDQV